MSKKYARIRQLAERVRAKHAGIPVPIEQIIRDHGIKLVFQPGGSDVSGLAKQAFDGQLVVGINSAQSYRRQRFTMAHELFHVLEHEGLSVDGRVVFGYRDRRREFTSEERDANLFAALLLMPPSAIGADLGIFDNTTFEGGVRDLAARYEVSEQAMLIRLYDYIDYLLPSR